MTAARWLPALFFAAALGAAAWRVPQPAPPAFADPPPATSQAQPSDFASEPLPVAGTSAHAATLAELSDGRLAAAWFAGSREGASDVAIWFAVRDNLGWSQPRIIADRATTADGTGMAVRKVGNPVLYAAGNGLHLWYVSTAVGGWAASSINHALSVDGGANWSLPVRLVTSPFLNVSTLVRTPPLPLADGGFGLPVYHELAAKHGERLRLAADGTTILGKERLVLPRRALQPATAILDSQRALALLRDAGPGTGHIQAAATTDGGARWQALPALPIANPNASVALLRLSSGRLLLAANPGKDRNVLRLFVSSDEGQSWQPSRSVAQSSDSGAEFSYPALLQGRDGRIHLAFTWLRQGIQHLNFTEAWLAGGTP